MNALIKALCIIVVGFVAAAIPLRAQDEKKAPMHEENSPAAKGAPQNAFESQEGRRLARPGRAKPHEEVPRSIDDFTKPIWRWQHATGDWGGARLWIDKRGITPEVIYTGEVFSNWHGGLNTRDATEYLSNLDMTLTFDTEKLGLWPGGRFFVYGEQLTGRSITERHVGDLQTLSELDSDPFTQVSEYWYEQGLFDNKLRVRVGKQDGNTNFAVVDYGLDFINSSFGLPPTVPIPTFPDPGLGIALFLEPVDWLWIGGGVYDGDADGGQWGFGTAFDGKGGTFSVVEAALKPSFGRDGRLPGKYAFGFWHHSDDHIEELIPESEEDGPAPRVFTRNYGVYAGIDQVLFREISEEGNKRLHKIRGGTFSQLRPTFSFPSYFWTT